MWPWLITVSLFVIAVVCAILWTILQYKLDRNLDRVGLWHWFGKWLGEDKRLSSWLNTFISVLLSVLLAVSAGFFTFKLEKWTEDGLNRDKLKRLMEVEFVNNCRRLGRLDAPNIPVASGESIHPDIVFLEFPIMEDAVKSGLFHSVTNQYMHELALDVREYNDYCRTILNCLAIGSANPGIERSVRFVNIRIAELQDSIETKINMVMHTVKIDQALCSEIKETEINKTEIKLKELWNQSLPGVDKPKSPEHTDP